MLYKKLIFIRASEEILHEYHLFYSTSRLWIIGKGGDDGSSVSVLVHLNPDYTKIHGRSCFHIILRNPFKPEVGLNSASTDLQLYLPTATLKKFMCDAKDGAIFEHLLGLERNARSGVQFS